METITLHFNQNIKEKLLQVLNSFSKSDLEIVQESQEFQDAKSEMQKDYQQYVIGNTKLMSVEESENELDELLRSNEN